MITGSQKIVFGMAVACLMSCLALPARAVVFRGLGLNELMGAYGFGAPAEYGKSAVYRSRTATVVFEAGSRRRCGAPEGARHSIHILLRSVRGEPSTRGFR